MIALAAIVHWLAVWMRPENSLSIQLAVMLVLVFSWGIINLIYAKKNSSNKNAISTSEADSVKIEVKAEESDGVIKKYYIECFDNYKKYCNQHRVRWETLPRFILIGKSGSGKTSLINSSHLFTPVFGNFYAAPITVNLLNNIWLSKDMALFEMPLPENFNYDNQGLKENLAFIIKSAKQNMGKRPFNGIILTIPATDLLDSNQINLTDFAVNIKHFFTTMTDLVGLRLPISIVVTHGDQILGFNEFFSYVNDVKQKTLGMQFSATEKASEKFDDYYPQLLKNLNQELFSQTSSQLTAEQNALRISFTLQLASIGKNIKSFLLAISSQTDYLLTYFIQGWYLVSNQQSGLALDNMVGLMPIKGKRKEGLSLELASMNQAYFSHNVLQKCLFNTMKHHKTRSTIILPPTNRTLIAMLGVSFFTVLCLTRWYQSFQSQTAKLNTIQELLHHSVLEQDGITRLANAYQISELFKQDKWKFVTDFGLYRGDAIQPITNQYYEQQLKNYFLPFLLESAEEEMNTNKNNYLALYDGLKTYLMLGKSQYRDKAYLTQWYSQQWNNAYDAETRAVLIGQLQALLSRPELKANLDNSLVMQERNILTKMTPAQYHYWNLKQTAAQSRSAINPAITWNSDFRQVFNLMPMAQSIPWFYTKEGYQQFYLKHNSVLMSKKPAQDWVLNEQSSIDNNAESFQAQIAGLYAQDYQHVWQQWISQIQLQPVNNLAQAINQLNLLSSPRSPLTNLVTWIDSNTHLTIITIPIKLPKAQTLIATETAAGTLDNAFIGWHQLVVPSSNQVTPLMSLQTSLGNLTAYMQNIANAENPNQAAFMAAKQLLSPGANIFTALNQQAATLPQPLKAWVQQIIQQNLSIIFSNAKNYVSSIWQAQVYGFYQQSIAGRFPFASDSSQEVALQDFNKFFAPQGILSTFIQAAIAPFYQIQQSYWQPKMFMGQSLNISAASLLKLNQLTLISQMFFAGNAPQPSIQFFVKPINLSANMLQVELDVSGQNLRYRHDPQEFTALSWPTNQPDGLQFNFTDLDQQSHTLQIPGIWAWFRFMNNTAKVEQKTPTTWVVTVTDAEASASYLFRTSSVLSPLFGTVFKNLGNLPNQLN